MQTPFSTTESPWARPSFHRAESNALLYANSVALGSLILLLGHVALGRPQKLYIYSGNHLLFRAVRFACCVILTGIASAQWAAHGELQQFTAILTFLYTAILSALPFKTTSWTHILIRHVNFVLCVQMAFYVYRDVYPLATYTKVPLDSDEGGILWVKIALLFVAAVGVPLTVPRAYVPVDLANPIPPNEEQTASILSSYLFSFLDRMIYLANKKRGEKFAYEDLPTLADYSYAANLKEGSFGHLSEFSGAPKRHILPGLLWTFRWRFLLALVYMSLCVPADYISALGINRLLTYLERPADAVVRPWVWIMTLFLGAGVGAVLNEAYTSTMYIVMIEAETIMVSLIFEHALRIRVKADTPSSPSPSSSTPQTSSSSTPATTTPASSSSTPATTTTPTSSSTTPHESAKEAKPAPPTSTNLLGRITNLIATDAHTAANKGKDVLRVVVYAPASFLLGTYFLWVILGWSAFVGLALMVLLAPVPGLVAKLIRSAKIKQLHATDARVQKVTETMSVLRMVKLFGWMSFSERQIDEKRAEELVWVKRAQLLNVATIVIGKILPAVSMLASYTVYAGVMKQPLTPAIVFSSITVFDSLGTKIRYFLFYLNNTITGKVSLDRIDTFLHQTELLDEFTADTADALPVPRETPERGIGFHNATFTWTAEQNTQEQNQSTRQFKLRIDDLTFRPGLNVVTGPSASGKTSMLLALLGEMHFVPSSDANAEDSWFNLPRAGGVAYCDQTSWVLNETIRNNILFGTPMDEARYKKVLYQCALEPDLALLEAGDLSEVGERGLTLSGGQQARVALARAVYSHASVVLLDDVLAALDVHTSLWIVRNCLSGDLLADRTVILVTHNVDITAPIAAYCVHVRNGTVWDQGLPSEVVAANKDLRTAPKTGEAEVAEKVEDLAAEKPAKPDGGKLIISEEVAIGHVSWKSMRPYFVALIGKHTIVLPAAYACCLFGSHITAVIQKYYLGVKWSALYEDHDPSEVSVSYHLGVYISIMMVALMFTSLDAILFMFGSIRGSKAIHKSLIASVLQTTLRWLDTTPVSRIIARCTADVASLDGMLPGMLKDVIYVSTLMVVELFSIVLVVPQIFFVGLLVGVLGYLIGQIYMAAQLGIKREVSNSKALILGHLGAAVGGLVSVRAYGAQGAFINQSFSRLDKYNRAIRPYENLLNWVAARLDILGGCFEAALAAYMVYFSTSTAAEAGFCLAQAAAFSGQILWFVYASNEFELAANSLERIDAYVDADKEPPATKEGKPPAYWPASGDLRVENLSARYSAHGPKVLDKVSFHIRTGERIGVVGRTGSGKSSLTLSLLRCINTEGTVYLDGLATSKINLDDLRNNITIIPQMPELLNASLRRNLDPFELYDDQTLNDALRAAGLFALHEDGHDDQKFTLDSNIASGGGNMSVGERQIVALARALVRRSKILILDEATSAVDYKTDAIIQQTLRTEVKGDMTLITIAHRLQTIMDADKILVLDAGHLVEFGTPKDLLANEDGKLRNLIHESADKDLLIEMAEKAVGRKKPGT